MRHPCPSSSPANLTSNDPTCSPLQGRTDKLRCYKTGRSSESVSALSVRTLCQRLQRRLVLTETDALRLNTIRASLQQLHVSL